MEFFKDVAKQKAASCDPGIIVFIPARREKEHRSEEKKCDDVNYILESCHVLSVVEKLKRMLPENIEDGKRKRWDSIIELLRRRVY